MSGRFAGSSEVRSISDALQLAAELLLELAQLLAGDALAARVVVGQLRLGLGAQSECPADPLDVDPEYA